MARHKVIGSDLDERRGDLAAFLGAVLAAGVELAALGGIYRAGDIALKDGLILSATEFWWRIMHRLI